MAALRILRDLVKKRGLEHPVDFMIRPEKKKEFWCGVSSYANFFKHAGRDPDDISDGFREELNDAVLLFAAFTYYDFLGCQRTEEMEALTTWYMTLHPNVLSQDANPAMQALVVLASGEIRSLPREKHLKIGLMLLKSKSNRSSRS